jgi:Tol biopolymer transport system component/serine/threonine protein kinase
MADAAMLGRRLAHYRVLEFLGSGAMGDVYRARDERLDREIALKVLPAGLSEADAARRRLRLRKECRALCRISHPHVATLLDFDTTDGLDFLAMELVPGPTLEAELRRGPLREDETVRLACQLARGLQAVHALGIVHRDVKPSNIAFTSDGLLKILDFGVAKLLTRLAGGVEAPAADTQTEAGTIAGSYAYMSPEQLLGEEVDGRSDLYAAGAVIYEMATGRRVFGSAKGAELTDAVLNRAPPAPGAAGAPVSPELQAIILKLLDKDPALRYQEARELLVDLQRLERGSSDHTPPRPRSGRSRHRRLRAVRVAASLLATGMLAGAAVAVAWRSRLAPAGPFPTPRSLMPLTSSPGCERHPALSPSGRRLAFVADGHAHGNTRVFVKDVDSHQAVALTAGLRPECCVEWTPDERSVAFVRLRDGRGSIVTVPAGGGTERRLADLVPWFGTGLSFSPDAATLVYPDRRTPTGPFGIHVLSLDTLESRPLTRPAAAEIGDGFPAFSPDGEWVAFVRVTSRLERGDVYVVSPRGGEPRRLTTDELLVGDVEWTADGSRILLWARRSNVGRVWQVDPKGGRLAPYWPEGDPVPHARFSQAEGVSRVSDAFRFSVARGTRQMAFTEAVYDTDIWQMAMSGGPRRPDEGARGPGRALISSTQTDESPHFSPDGRWIAFSSVRSGRPEVWVCDRAGSSCAPLVSVSSHDGTPRWSPDGGQIAFDARPGDRSRIYVVDVETRLVRPLTGDESDGVVPSWSRDGRWVYFASSRTGSWQVFRIPAEGGVARQVTVGGGFAAFESPASADRILYTRVDSPGLWTVPASGGTETRLLDEPRCWGHWAVAAAGVYVGTSVSGQLPRVLLLDLRTGRRTTVATLQHPLPCGESSLAVSPDGRELLYAGIRESSDLVGLRD